MFAHCLLTHYIHFNILPLSKSPPLVSIIATHLTYLLISTVFLYSSSFHFSAAFSTFSYIPSVPSSPHPTSLPYSCILLMFFFGSSSLPVLKPFSHSELFTCPHLSHNKFSSKILCCHSSIQHYSSHPPSTRLLLPLYFILSELTLTSTLFLSYCYTSINLLTFFPSLDTSTHTAASATSSPTLHFPLSLHSLLLLYCKDTLKCPSLSSHISSVPVPPNLPTITSLSFHLSQNFGLCLHHPSLHLYPVPHANSASNVILLPHLYPTTSSYFSPQLPFCHILSVCMP